MGSDIYVSWLSARANVQHAHHLMVLMGEDVAMPHVAAGLVEGHLDAGDLTRQSRDHVLGRVFNVPGRLRDQGTGHYIFEPEPVTEKAVVLHHRLIDHISREHPAVQNIEMNQVQVHRVGVAGGVVDLPDLGVAQRRVFCGGRMPGDGALHLADQTRVDIFRGVRPHDWVVQVIGGRLGRAQQRLQPSELVHALEQRHLANAVNGVVGYGYGYIRIADFVRVEGELP
jgi:hypothetical protein